MGGCEQYLIHVLAAFWLGIESHTRHFGRTFVNRPFPSPQSCGLQRPFYEDSILVHTDCRRKPAEAATMPILLQSPGAYPTLKTYSSYSLQSSSPRRSFHQPPIHVSKSRIWRRRTVSESYHCPALLQIDRKVWVERSLTCHHSSLIRTWRMERPF